jgi:D-glycero-D-manno-heptose 1,7-bisphosphate phosphatase
MDGLRRAVFLDRDGVVNQSLVRNGKPYPPSCLEELVILPGVPEALAKLRAEGYLCIVITNQPDVATGVQSLAEVERIHAYLRDTLFLDDIFTCYHVASHRCSCRKPRPGMLLSAARRHAIALSQSFMLGDRWRDIEAGKAAGCKTFFIYWDNHEPLTVDPDYIVPSLAHAGEIILGLNK